MIPAPAPAPASSPAPACVTADAHKNKKARGSLPGPWLSLTPARLTAPFSGPVRPSADHLPAWCPPRGGSASRTCPGQFRAPLRPSGRSGPNPVASISSGRSSFTFGSFSEGRITSDARAFCAEHLFLDSADRQHNAGKRNLARHRHARPDRAPVSKLTRAVTIATPADGPSFGIAPDGTWMCKSCLRKKSGSMP